MVAPATAEAPGMRRSKRTRTVLSHDSHDTVNIVLQTFSVQMKKDTTFVICASDLCAVADDAHARAATEPAWEADQKVFGETWCFYWRSRIILCTKEVVHNSVSGWG